MNRAPLDWGDQGGTFFMCCVFLDRKKNLILRIIWEHKFRFGTEEKELFNVWRNHRLTILIALAEFYNDESKILVTNINLDYLYVRGKLIYIFKCAVLEKFVCFVPRIPRWRKMNAILENTSEFSRKNINDVLFFTYLVEFS